MWRLWVVFLEHGGGALGIFKSPVCTYNQAWAFSLSASHSFGFLSKRSGRRMPPAERSALYILYVWYNCNDKRQCCSCLPPYVVRTQVVITAVCCCSCCMIDSACNYLQTMTYVLLYEYVPGSCFSLNEGNKCVPWYCCTHARTRTRVYVPGTVAAACCMLHTSVQ